MLSVFNYSEINYILHSSNITNDYIIHGTTSAQNRRASTRIAKRKEDEEEEAEVRKWMADGKTEMGGGRKKMTLMNADVKCS